jgi:hypothetical protein
MQTLVFKNKWQENKRNSVCRWVLEGRERAKGEGEGQVNMAKVLFTPL